MVTVTNTSQAPKSRAHLTGSGSEGPTPRAGKSEYIKGALVSLHMVNFLSCEDAFVQFGPRLNVVMGPNGTGKSTLVCAMALVLAGSPKVLGRADNLHSFVTHGVNKDASVEAELFIPDGQNLKIKRTFSRKNNSSNYHINGRSKAEKEVKERVAQLNIQVENMCTFLPQDKVGAFSGFTPDKLLVECQKALDRTNLYEPHQNLINMQDETGRREAEERAEAENLANLQTELELITQDVQRMEQRARKQEQLDLHEKKKLWLKVQRVSELGKATKVERKLAEKKLTEAKEADGPLLVKEKRWEKEVFRLRGVLKQRSEDRELHETQIQHGKKKVEKLMGSINTAKATLNNIGPRRKKMELILANKKDNLKKLKNDLTRLVDQRAEYPPEAEAERKMDVVRDKMNEAASRITEQKDKLKDAAVGMKTVELKMKQLTNQKAQRENAFIKKFKLRAETAMKARKWVDANPDKLQRRVWGPAALEVTMDDKEAAAAMEHHVPGWIWCSLVAECKEDHDTILYAMGRDTGPLTVSIVHGGILKPDRRPHSDAELQHLRDSAGVRGYLSDFCKCEDVVRQSLKVSSGFHMVLLGNQLTEKRINNDPNFLLSLSGKGGSTIFSGGGGAPLQQYATKISQYSKKSSTRVTEAKPADVVGEAVDEEAVHQQELKRAGFENDMSQATAKMKTWQGKHNKLQADYADLRNTISNIESVRSRVKKTENKIKALEHTIQDLEADVARGIDEERERNLKRLASALKCHVEAVEAAQRHQAEMLTNSAAWFGVRMRTGFAEDELAGVRDDLKKAGLARADLEGRVRELLRQEDAVRKEFKIKKMHAEKLAPRKDQETGQPTLFDKAYDDLPDNMEGLDEVIEVLKDELAGFVDNPEVVEKQDELKQSVSQTENALNEIRASNENAQETMAHIRTPWEEMLQMTVDTLNDRFKEYMKDLRNEASVVLARDDSFKKWGLEIQVRFRTDGDATQQLKTLNAQTHSGGERAVSTILFLMAMQDMQRSPFAVVDEINQGMDHENERSVFSRIVLNSCGPNRKQYFLITPKLLQGLVAMDKDDVTIVVIMNGPKCIRGTAQNSMAELILAKKRQLGLLEGDGSEDGGARGPKIPRRTVSP